MLSTIGTLVYYDNPYKLIVNIDDEIGNYYRSLIPKYLDVRKPMYPSHISVIRNEVPPNIKLWNKYHDRHVHIVYENFIYNDEVYYWLNAYSFFLEDVREGLGLASTSQYTKSPDGQHKFHITIGNVKHQL